MNSDKPQYPQLERKFHDAESERLISEFWRRENVFRRSISEREGKPDFVFYEGPPTANGMPGVHHVMARLCKDIACRYKTMTGHRVVRKAGWDTHGLPVERAVEKELDIQGRRAIEEFGIGPFNEACRKSVWSCKEEWDDFTERLGYWVDLDDPYITYDSNYIETVWWILSRFAEADLLYKGHKVVPYCPTCGTPLSTHEVSSGYRTVTETSIYVKLKVLDDDASFVTWTTTPWTLPSNVALAVGEDFDYVKVRHRGENLILAEARIGILEPEDGFEILERYKGRDLIGRRYEPLFPFLPAGGKPGHRIVPADFVTLDSGSGIVHMAPPFGEDDYQVGVREDLPFFRPVAADGQFTEEVPPYAGIHVKKADPKIIDDLREAGALLKTEDYSHEYPFHDRCNSALIYYATPSWFIRTTALREKLIEANADIRWVPEEVGSNRFGNWLAGNIDWSLSRNRFWGTPLNVWVCDRCGALEVPGGRAELSRLTGEDCADLDLHRPHVDDIEFGCTAEGCGGTMRRVPEVIDCWFDSGSMPYAQYHYPFENKELFESQFPADFISEGIDQTRGWFYTMLVIGAFLFGRSSYKSCLTIELILDKNGKKMSKSLGNAVDPREILREEGADPLRWYMLTVSPVWMPTRFDREGVGEARRKLLATLENTYSFFALYANLEIWRPGEDDGAQKTLMDRWILSRLHSVTAAAREALDALDFTRAGRVLGAFVQEDLSNWYVRLNRRRFWQGDKAAFATLYAVLDGSLRLLAPFIPFTTEEIYRDLHQREDGISVHLADYPESDSALIDAGLETAMASAQQAVGVGRSLRQEARIRTRQPLARLLIHSTDSRAADLCADRKVAEILREELNVKEVAVLDDPASVVEVAAKANFRALGPRFGKGAPEAAKRIVAMTAEEIGVLRAAGEVELEFGGRSATFGHDEIQVVESGIDPYVAASENGLTLALETTLTPELADEGLSREIINRVQGLRKKSGLEVSDRILLKVSGGQDVERVMGVHGDRIHAETLATGAGDGDALPFADDFKIDDLEVSVALAPIDEEHGGDA